MAVLDYVLKQFKLLPAHRWTCTNAAGDALKVTEHTAGFDWQRGPWIKFKFEENGQEMEIQGYMSKKERIKFGPKGAMKECDNDDIDFAMAGDVDPSAVPELNAAGLIKLLVIAKFFFTQEGKAFAYRFVGHTN